MNEFDSIHPRHDTPSRPKREVMTPAHALHQGVQYLQQNELLRARECFEQAMLADPRNAVARNCLGIVARTERRVAEAMALFHKAIELQPGFAEAHNNMGNAYRDTGSIAEAAECYRRALAIKPDFAEGQNNLGVALLAVDDLPGAIQCFEKAIRLQPSYAEAHNNLANAYYQDGDLVGAAASLATALQLKPNSSEIHNNLGNVLRESGQFELARQHYEQAIRLRPDFAGAYENLGTVLLDLGRGDDAIQCYERARHLQEPNEESLVNLGNAFRLVGRVADARSVFEQAARLRPSCLWNRLRVTALCPPAFESKEQMESERSRALWTWSKLAQERKGQGAPPLDSRLAEPSFAWQFLDGNLRPLKESYASIFADGWSRESAMQNEARPRVGIVVTGGHEGIFIRSLGGVLQRIHSTAFAPVVVCPARSVASIQRGIGREIATVPLPTDFRGAVEAIRAAGFSLLYFWEIGTDATNYFLPMFKLAPVQCTSWGVQVTSGMPQVHYYLGCECVESNRARDHYTEKLLLSSSLLTYQTPPQLPSPAKTRADFGFHDRQHLYVCAQQLGKFHPDFDELIGDILRNDLQGVFVAVSDRYRAATEIVQQRMSRALPDVCERIVFLPRLSFDDYLQLINVADALLDPPHFGGVNSTYDALAVAQPIVTLPSEFHRGRYTAACLRQIGLHDTIASDTVDYVRVAVSIGCDRRLQADLRKYIREANGAVFHDLRSVREHERLFEEVLHGY